jgi:hypothetical protein
MLLLFKGLFLGVMLLFIFTMPSPSHSTAQRAMPTFKEDCSASNCRLPLCKCSNTRIPNDIEYDDTPMMIALSFSGVLTAGHAKYLKKILNPVFKNPNDCPIQSTLFLSHSGNGTSDYCFVQGLFNNNNEIGVGSKAYR